MQLRAGERREVIEDLLDIQIFTVMNTLLKERVTENKADINDIKHNIELLNSKISTSKTHNDSIRKMREVEVDKLKEKLTRADFYSSSLSKSAVDVLIRRGV